MVYARCYKLAQMTIKEHRDWHMSSNSAGIVIIKSHSYIQRKIRARWKH